MHQQALGLQNMSQASLLCEFVKKHNQFILSLSVFSFFFLHPSWLYFIHSFMPYYNTFPSQIFSIATEKNYIFLLCNGILVFIVRYSTRSIESQQPAPSETSPNNDIIFKEYTQTSMQLTVENLVVVEYVAIEECEIEKSSEVNVAMTNEETKGGNYLITDSIQTEEDDGVSEDDEGDEEYESGYYVAEEEEEEEDEEMSMMSTEDLNRRFEDFIRKMKEEHRIEAQQQLIMV